MFHKISWTLAAVITFSTGCDDGALGQAEISGECADGNFCGPTLGQGPLAMGGSGELSFQLSSPGTSTPYIELQVVDPGVVQADGQRVFGVAPGMSAILLLDSEGLVLDFLHVFVEIPDALAIIRLDSSVGGSDIDGLTELLVDDSLLLTVVPTLGHQLMAGQAVSTWTANPEILSVLADGDPSRRRLIARQPGKTTVTVESMGLTRTFTIHVLP